MAGPGGVGAFIVLLSALAAEGGAPMDRGGELILQAERARVRTVGGPLEGGGWNVWSNGSLGDWFVAEGRGKIAFTVRAAGTPAKGEYPLVEISATDESWRALGSARLSVGSREFRDYSIEFDAPAGRFVATVTFTNDLFDKAANEDRNLLVKELRVRGAALAEGVPTVKERTEGAILELRTGRLSIRTSPRARVRVTQLSHEFPFGTAIAGRMFRDDADPVEKRKYLETLKANFNAAVHENELKWYHTERNGPGNPDYSDADRMLEWCERNGLAMRGHCIFWGVDQFVQDWVKKLDDAALRAALERRAKDIVGRYKGRIREFDLNNEMLHGDYYARRLGPGITADMFRWAKEANPEVVLYVNDYNILSGGDSARYVEQIKGLLARGIPVGGIGCQGHVGGSIVPEVTRRVLDDLAQFRLPIKITEFDANTDDEGLKARTLEDVYRLAFAHPAVEGILMWGFWEGAHWIPKAALWKRDFTPTPAAKTYRDLVFGEWWTNVELVADRSGRCETRAFFGRHRVESEGRSVEVELSKRKGSAAVEIRR